MTMTYMPTPINARQLIRIIILAALLTVGSLNVTRCTEADEDGVAAARDQYDRMHRIVINLTQ